jgi:DNA-binding NtrC family response regulator
LRDRADDRPLLLAELLRRSRIARDREICAVSPEALAALGEYRWPGNIRELDNVIQRACLACYGKELEVHHLPPEVRATSSRRALRGAGGMIGATGNGPAGPALRHLALSGLEPRPALGSEPTLREIESSAVRAALASCGGNVTAAARMLGVSRTKLYRDLKKV